MVILLEEVCAGSEGRGEAIAQKLLNDFIPVFNELWPPIAVEEGLDPYGSDAKPVYDGPVELGCGAYAEGDAACAVLTDGPDPLDERPFCASFYADVDVTQIDGLSHLAITSLDLESTNQQVGTSCPYDSKAVENTSFRCSLDGTSRADVKLTAQAKVDVSSIKLKLKCTNHIPDVPDKTVTLWTGNAKCTSSHGTATAKVDYCAGICSADAGLSSLVALKADDLKFDLDPNCDPHTTSVDYPPITESLDYLLAAVLDDTGDAIANAAAPAVTSALNDLVKMALPLPVACTKESGR